MTEIFRKNVVESLLEQDFYKLTMGQIFYNKFSHVNATYQYKCRTNIDLTPYINDIKREIDHLCTLSFQYNEIEYLRTRNIFSENYLNFLSNFKLNRQYINIDIIDNNLNITSTGPLIQTSMFEIFVLRIVSEVYSRHNYIIDINNGESRLLDKIDMIQTYLSEDPTNTFKLIDMGSRRAFSTNWHFSVVELLKNHLPSSVFIGTSNMKFAQILGIPCVGTQAHEYFQVHQSVGGCLPIDSQIVAMDNWLDEYDGVLSTCLTDTLTTDLFLKQFTRKYAMVFDSVRHDSGDIYQFTNKMVNHYKSLNIDSKTKNIMYSDGLNIPICVDLARYNKNIIGCAFGVGTNLSCDIDGITPIQSVMKVVEVNGNPVAKISDSAGKGMCNDLPYISYLTNEIYKKVNY